MPTEQKVTIANPAGLHARPAAKLVELATGFPCTIEIVVDGRRANARSILSLMKLGLQCGTEVTISASGEQEADAVARIAAHLGSNG